MIITFSDEDIAACKHYLLWGLVSGWGTFDMKLPLPAGYNPNPQDADVVRHAWSRALMTGLDINWLVDKLKIEQINTAKSNMALMAAEQSARQILLRLAPGLLAQIVPARKLLQERLGEWLASQDT